MKKISILHPSRQRVERALDAFNRWTERAGIYNIEYLLSIDSDDDVHAYKEAFKDFPIAVTILVNNNRSAIDAINNAAKIATGDIFIVVSDDFDCPNNWAQQIIDATKNMTDWIMKTPDGYQKWMITLPIMDRAYYNRFGYIYFPEYRHLFPDLELSCVANYLQKRITHNIPFKHNHYSLTGEKKDAVSLRADSTWSQGEELFVKRFKKNFDLTEDQMVGTINDAETNNWILKILNKY